LGTVDQNDVNAAISMSIGALPCTANIMGANVCHVVMTQRVVNGRVGPGIASLGLTAWWWHGAPARRPHYPIAGYNVYRAPPAPDSVCADQHCPGDDSQLYGWSRVEQRDLLLRGRGCGYAGQPERVFYSGDGRLTVLLAHGVRELATLMSHTRPQRVVEAGAARWYHVVAKPLSAYGFGLCVSPHRVCSGNFLVPR